MRFGLVERYSDRVFKIGADQLDKLAMDGTSMLKGHAIREFRAAVPPQMQR